ncbi:MAG: HlyD family secretion protein [Bdellovibrionales bacterium]|nr:HlyD family secretion protein [Bdellovibrionales bacterium]
MKEKKKSIIGIVSVLVLTVVIYFIYEHIMFVETDNAQVEAPTVMLAVKVPGYVKNVLISEGQKVKKGEVLVQIDNRDYQSAYDAAKSELLSLEARKKDAEKNYYRIKELYSKSVVSSQQYDSATANYNEIKAKYDSASARLVQSELNLENTEIKAPVDGVVARKSVEIGQLASPGTPMIGFVSSEDRWITANFKETDIEDIKVGKVVDIKIDAISGRSYLGKVESISSATGSTFTLLPPDNATGNFTKVVQRVPVKVKFDQMTSEDIDQLQAGLSAVVKVHVH